MFSTSGATLGVSKLPCRSLEAVGGSSSRHLFVVGTTALASENEVHLVEFEEEYNTLRSLAVWQHPNEVWSLAPHPSRGELLFTCSNSGSERVATLYKVDIPDAGQETASAAPEELLTLPKDAHGKLRQVVWHPVDELDDQPAQSERFVTLQDGGLQLWDLLETKADNIGTCAFHGESVAHAAAWNPHHAQQVFAARGADVEAVDLRSMEVSLRLEMAHRGGALDVDCNPNKPYFVLSGGADRTVKFWDVRKPDAPVKVITPHQHWVARAKFNRFHDSLVLTSGTDAGVALYRISSISSAPLLELDEEEEEEAATTAAAAASSRSAGNGAPAVGDTADARVKLFEEHGESVYGAAWSAHDAWVLASLSLDGKLVINHVPSAEKYKILL